MLKMLCGLHKRNLNKKMLDQSFRLNIVFVFLIL
jgi:hypothetical protein